MPSNNEIAILDFGSQYTHLIARRVRELGVISHIYPNNVPTKELKNAVGIILSGGPRSLIRDPRLPFDEKLFDLKLPILGLCYGHQLIAEHFGGAVATGTAREYGLAKMQTAACCIFRGVEEKTQVWMSHGDHVERLPQSFHQIATTESRSIAAMANCDKKIYGFQFHPEVYHTEEGKKMLNNFVLEICLAKKNWTTDKMMAEVEENIKKQAGDKNVFLLVSGGVDSTVCFALLEKVLGKNRVYGLTVNHGFARQNEVEKVAKTLKKIGLDNLHVYDAEEEYLKALERISDPEQKRKIIGNLFLDITDRIMKEKGMTGGNWLVGQGTIYPDTIESGGTKNADVIKTHHNRVPKIQQMILAGKIIEPIKELYKDEVREIGLRLGLPKEMVFRHPFPGPGLAIRCLCSDGSDEKTINLDCLTTQAEKINLLKLPIKSVGVQGDERSYSHPAVILGKRREWKNLREISPQITNAHKEINRVLTLIWGDKKMLERSTISPAFLTKQRLNLLRKIDNIVDTEISKDSLCKKIWQFPVVLIPFGNKRGESVVLRPVESEEAMTVSFGIVPEKTLKRIIKKISALKAVDFIFYDLTNKPPATIEWE